MAEELEKKIKAAADNYANIYEMTLMNTDTPRLSGREYLTHGYEKGVDMGIALGREQMLREVVAWLDSPQAPWTDDFPNGWADEIERRFGEKK